MEIRIIYSDDAAYMTRELLRSYQIEKRIPSAGSRIVIKPNLVVPERPEDGATTHTEIVAAVIGYLQEHGFRNITIAEGSWVGASTEEAFRRLGYYRIRDRYSVDLVDTKKDRFRKMEYAGIRMEVSETFLQADYFINIPVLKGHCQTAMTCCMKNLKGCLSDKSKRNFHHMGLMHPIAALNAILKPDVNIVDSISGDLDFEEGGNPVTMDRMYLGEDSVLMDAFSATLMGFSPEDIEYIPIAAGYGIGSMDTSEVELIALNEPKGSSVKPTGAAMRLSAYTAPDMACSACYASLIHALKRMDDAGNLHKLSGIRIACGQGYRGKSVRIGTGSCCRGEHTVPGCPPSAADILSMLEAL